MTLQDLKLKHGYSTSSDDMLSDFYLQCLSRSVDYKRATGYFSSALFTLAPLAFADFFERGGKFQLACSPQITEEDARALQIEEVSAEDQFAKALIHLQNLAQNPQDPRSVLATALSSLIQAGVVELKFLVNKTERGIFHDKYGVFSDSEGNRVSFIGSANESAAAWSGFVNHEQIEVFQSWVTPDRDRIDGHESKFEQLWSGQANGISVIDSDEVARRITDRVPPEPISEILHKLRRQIKNSILVKEASSPIVLRSYQKAVLENWVESGNRGIVSFATGGGKTLTAISAIKDWVAQGKVAIVLVPSTLLMEQWMDEIRSWIGDTNLLQVGGSVGKNRWRQELYRFTQSTVNQQRVVVSTYASAATQEFRDLVDNGDHILLVADEVHRFGATDTRVIGEWLRPGAFLGLSATPERYGDAEGTKAIQDFFGQILEPRFTLDDAINGPEKVLVPYEYFFQKVALTQDEQAEWDSLSERILLDWHINKSAFSEQGRQLLIKRSRISKRAVNKTPAAAKIIQDNFRKNDRWLVYCESISHLNSVRKAIECLEIPELTVMEYHASNPEEHVRVLNFFTNRGGVVLAIKCLDEGIDIPIINKAIIMSSSTNPREYVQRRGRVLRRHPHKVFASVWDLLTFSEDGKPISVNELIRAEEFAKTSQTVSTQLTLEHLIDLNKDMYEFETGGSTAEDGPQGEE